VPVVSAMFSKPTEFQLCLSSKYPFLSWTVTYKGSNGDSMHSRKQQGKLNIKELYSKFTHTTEPNIYDQSNQYLKKKSFTAT
jgi:hypothetical protein